MNTRAIASRFFMSVPGTFSSSTRATIDSKLSRFGRPAGLPLCPGLNWYCFRCSGIRCLLREQETHLSEYSRASLHEGRRSPYRPAF